MAGLNGFRLAWQFSSIRLGSGGNVTLGLRPERGSSRWNAKLGGFVTSLVLLCAEAFWRNSCLSLAGPLPRLLGMRTLCRKNTFFPVQTDGEPLDCYRPAVNLNKPSLADRDEQQRRPEF